MQTRKSIFLYTALFYTLYVIFPLFGDLASLLVWLPSMLTVVLLLVLYPKAFTNKVMNWFGVYAAVLGLYVIIGKPLTIGIGSVEDSKKIFIEFAYILPTIGIFSIFDYLKDYKLAKKFVTWSIIILYASFVVAVPLMVQYNSLRAAYVQGETSTVTILGLPGYSLMHAYTLFLPVVCYAVKMNVGHQRLLWIVSLIALLFVIYSTFVTTSLVVALAILVLAFTYNGTRTSSYWFYMVVLALVFIVLYESGALLSIVDVIYPLFEDTDVAAKLDDFRDSLKAGELQGGTIVGRQNLHAQSWDAFFSSPIWGNPNVGGHSSILDRFGGLGLLGGLPFVMILVSFYKMASRWYTLVRTRYFFILGFLSGIIFLYEKGNWACEAWMMLMVMMPTSIMVLEHTNENSIKSK